MKDTRARLPAVSRTVRDGPSDVHVRPVPSAQGKPLDPSVRAPMEARFGYDFGNVRIHLDAASAACARALDARAYTIGSDIAFAAGEYAPESAAGRTLIAHELAHVVQQSRGGATTDAESRADGAAATALAGRNISRAALGGAPLSVQRQPQEAPRQEQSDAPTVTTHQTWGYTYAEFALNSAAVPGKHDKAIDELAFSIALHVGMLRNGRAAISIIGHTDRSGDERLNLDLGQSRADAMKARLAAALARNKLDPARYGDLATSSLGEIAPAVPTKDGVQNAQNRRVEVKVDIGSVVTPPPTTPPKIRLFPTPLSEETAPRGPQRPRDLWREMEDNRKRIEEYDRKHPRKPKSLQEAVIDKVIEGAVDPILKKLPLSKDLRDKARDGIRKGLEAGSEKVCEAVIDASGAKGADADALKAACKAAIKAKPDAGGPP